MTGGTFSTQVQRANETTAVFTLEGRLRGRPECFEFLEELRAQVAETRNVVLDMCKVDHVDSTGVGILAAIYTSVTNAHGTLVLACLTPRVRKILDVLWFLRVLDHTETVEDALAHLKEKQTAPESASE